jgi:hypothetical protein
VTRAPAELSPGSMALGTFVPMLQTLSRLLDKGAEHARASDIDSARLTIQAVA